MRTRFSQSFGELDSSESLALGLTRRQSKSGCKRRAVRKAQDLSLAVVSSGPWRSKRTLAFHADSVALHSQMARALARRLPPVDT